jgi:RNA polymerase sigma-70 factor (ECF subfamily)
MAMNSTHGTTSINRQAFEALVRPCFDSLYRTAYRMTGDRHSAEDLVQETCLKSYANLHSFKSGTNFRAWLFRIMTNTFIDARRRNSKAPVLSGDLAYVDAAAFKATAAAPYAQSEPEIHILHRTFKSDALKAMAPEIRAVLSLALLEEFSYREIADVVSCPIGTVRSRLNKGRTMLRAALRDYQPGGQTKPSETVINSLEENDNT